MPSCPRTPVCLLPPRGENTTRTLSQLHGMIYGARQEEETLGSTELHRAAPSRTEPHRAPRQLPTGCSRVAIVVPGDPPAKQRKAACAKQPAQGRPSRRRAVHRAPHVAVLRSALLCAALRCSALCCLPQQADPATAHSRIAYRIARRAVCRIVRRGVTLTVYYMLYYVSARYCT